MLGLELPPGRLIDAGGTSHVLEAVGEDDGPWREPLLWHAEDGSAPGAWAALAAPARASGLLPVLVDVGGSQNGPQDWELMPDEVSYPGDHDADEVLAEFWEEYAADELDADQDYPGKDRVVEVFGEQPALDETIAPYGPLWPGLAAAIAPEADPDARAAEIADSLAGHGSWLKQPGSRWFRRAAVPTSRRRSAGRAR